MATTPPIIPICGSSGLTDIIHGKISAPKAE